MSREPSPEALEDADLMAQMGFAVFGASKPQHSVRPACTSTGKRTKSKGSQSIGTSANATVLKNSRMGQSIGEGMGQSIGEGIKRPPPSSSPHSSPSTSSAFTLDGAAANVETTKSHNKRLKAPPPFSSHLTDQPSTFQDTSPAGQDSPYAEDSAEYEVSEFHSSESMIPSHVPSTVSDTTGRDAACAEALGIDPAAADWAALRRGVPISLSPTLSAVSPASLSESAVPLSLNASDAIALEFSTTSPGSPSMGLALFDWSFLDDPWAKLEPRTWAWGASQAASAEVIDFGDRDSGRGWGRGRGRGGGRGWNHGRGGHSRGRGSGRGRGR